jgi:hypothetical protein
MSQKRLFAGMYGTDSTPGSSTDPSSLTNIAGIGADTADANWQIMYNDGAGTATKVDTGWPKTVGETLWIKVVGSGSDIKISAALWAAANFTVTPTSTFAEATYTTDIMTGSTACAPMLLGWNGATAETGQLAYMVQKLIAPY